MSGFRIVVVVLVYVLAAGCGSKKTVSVISRPIKDWKETTNGLTYSLPKRVLAVTIPYVVKQATIYTNGIPEKQPPEIECPKPLSITPLLVPDRSASYVLEVDNIANSAWFESNFSLTTTESGILQGVSADTKDKAIETIQSIFSAALSVAKMATVKGADLTATCENAVRSIPGHDERLKSATDPKIRAEIEQQIRGLEAECPLARTYLRIAKILVDAPSERDQDKLKKLREELVELYSFVRVFQENNREESSQVEGSFSTIVDLLNDKRCTYDNATRAYVCKNLLPKLTTSGGVKQPPTVNLRVSGLDAPSVSKNGANEDDRHDLKGIAVRRAAFGVVSLEVDNVVVLETVVDFPEFGTTQVVAAPTKRLTNRKTSLGFGAVSGGLTTFSLESGSSADKVAAAIKGSAAELQTAVSEIRQAQLEAEKAQREAAQARLDAVAKQLEQIAGVLNQIKAIQDAGKALQGGQ